MVIFDLNPVYAWFDARKEARSQKRTAQYQLHRWYAWYPVELTLWGGKGKVVWLQEVWRYRKEGFLGNAYWNYGG